MNILKRYKLLSLFLALIFIGVVGRLIFGEDSLFWTIWGVLDTSSAVALAVLAFFAYRDLVKEEDDIKLFFSVSGKLIDTNIRLLRKDCTRGEIVGVLGMMQKDTGKRFKITPKELRHLLGEIRRVQKEGKDRVVINMSQDEFEQFEIVNLIKK